MQSRIVQRREAIESEKYAEKFGKAVEVEGSSESRSLVEKVEQNSLKKMNEKLTSMLASASH